MARWRYRASYVGLIDFDLTGPGPRLRDVAYGAYWFTPLSFNSEDQLPYSEADLRSGSRRLKLYCASYGIEATTELLEMVEEVLGQMGDEEHVAKLVGPEAAAKLIAEGHLRGWRREASAFRNNKHRIARNFDLGQR